MSVPDVLPPSPPTTNHRHRISLPLPFKPTMSTPEDSPASFPPSSGAGTRKRVEFSPWPNVVDKLFSTPSSDMAALKALPPSRNCQTNSRSILKPFVEPVVSVTSYDGPNDVHTASPETLETIARQLANNNKGSSLDAYQILSQVIKAYDEIPEDANTRSSIANILRCIKRDLSMQDQTQSSPIDTNLITQALKVSVILVWSEHISPLLTDEFRVFIIDRSINTLTEHTAPKIIIIHYMHLLAMQNFRSGILTSNNRAVKLLEALQEITDHVQGKGAIAERLLIYQKLIEQAKAIMKARSGLWIKEIFLGLSSSVKDIRDKAISVCTRACAAFPASPTVSAVAREVLSSTIEDRMGNSRTLSSILTQRLEKMVAAKDEAIQVPQIWALGMLLCNSIDIRLESWNLLRDWLKVIQRCFNCSDISIRSQAFPAWNRFIYISRPHEASETIVSMLAKPIISQIERASINTTGKGLRPAAVSSFCTLLYYAFRPAASHKQYTRMWNEYIVKIIGSQFLSKSTANADLCSRVIMSLMWKEQTASRIWNENRAHENTLLDPEDLPTIDCKWVRSKTEAVLQIFSLLFNHSVWGPSIQHSDQAYVAKAWRHFLKAFRESTSKEIKPSPETKKALSHIIQFVREIPEANVSPSIVEGRSQLVCSIAFAELGPLCFLEALETDINMQSPIILTELIKATTNYTLTAKHEKVQSKSSTSSLPHSLQRSMKILDASLQNVYEGYNGNSSFLQSIISITSRTLKLLQPDQVFPSLVALQQGLATAIEDKKQLAKFASKSTYFLGTWTDFSETVVSKLKTLPISKYERLDHLLAATLLSSNVFTKNSLLTAWTSTSWQETDSPYGRELSNAITLMRCQTDINLPGITNILKNSQTPVQRDIQTHSSSKDAQVIDSVVALIVPDVLNDSVVAGADREVDSPAMTVAPKQRRSMREKGNGIRNQSRHDDSQLHVVPVDCSPIGFEEIESQFLTERQKEVRDRQHAGQVVTFPDLRSSPRPRSARGSRAPSADCEMARKVAAMDTLPSTPTISRQHDIMDEDELPSPTPKARHKKLDVIDIEIPSSPPSVTGHRKTAIGIHDVPSSPPNPHTEPEIDMVNLDDAKLAREASITEPNKGSSGTGEDAFKAVMTDEAIGRIAAANITEATTNIVAEPSLIDPNLDSTVLETVQEANIKRSGMEAPFRETPPDAGDYRNGGSDEIDELSASQLSQSLDWHIAEEAKYSAILTDSQQTAHATSKRRKRPVSGYADQDRKKRRRRTASHTETSLSSIASDESHMSSEDPNTEDYITVSTSLPNIPDKQFQSINSEKNGYEQASSTPSAGKRRRANQKTYNCIPLHTKTTSSDVMEGDIVVSEVTTQKVQEALNGNLEELVTKSTMRKSGDNIVEGQEPHLEKGTGGTPDEVAARWEPIHRTGVVELPLHTPDVDIMTALQTALDGLKSIEKGQQANIDLKAIDDLCFNIRYRAQEILRERSQQ